MGFGGHGPWSISRQSERPPAPTASSIDRVDSKGLACLHCPEPQLDRPNRMDLLAPSAAPVKFSGGT
jgi:hypothetical protein